MIIVQDVIISDDIVTEKFACNLSACKGACCWEGDFGAPLEEDECTTLERIYPQVEPFLSPAGQAAIAQQGLYVYYPGNESTGTPLIDGGACAYLVMGADGVAACGIERAWQAGAVDFQKPVSCHLYPIRVTEGDEGAFQALNYDQWDICAAACQRGDREQIRVYEFVREALIRKYGADFYEELDAAAKYMNK